MTHRGMQTCIHADMSAQENNFQVFIAVDLLSFFSGKGRKVRLLYKDSELSLNIPHSWGYKT